jgi:hypothetical protein
MRRYSLARPWTDLRNTVLQVHKNIMAARRGASPMNQKLAEARILACRKMPYMTHQVMTLIPVERRGLGTMAVDEYCRMYYDPAFLEGRDLKHLAFVVLHEAIHVWNRHGKRCVRLLGEKPAHDRLGIWRQAVDAAVNDVLEQSAALPG